jgi:flagellar hook protein FlgE
MLRSLYSGISGMHAFQTKLDVIGNNIANVNTVGFKAGRVMFSDILSQTIQGASAPVDPAAGTNPQQIGLGTQISAIDTIFTSGSPETTNIPTDCAIDGPGFFKVSRDGTNFYYTRAGNFTVDSAGNLATPDGYVVYGPDGAVKADGAISATIAPDGTVTFMKNDGTTETHQIGLVTFLNPGGLEKVGGNLYQETVNSSGGGAPQNPDPVLPGQNGTKPLRVGALEMSNVDLTNEFAEMIVAQRGFDANSKIISTDNQILQDIINLKQ